MVLLHAQGQTLARDSVPHPLRAWAVGAGAAVFTAGSLVALDHAWYQGYERTGLHFFNDGAEWYQVDKLGHAHSAYQLGRAGHASFRWAGMREGTATWVGGSLGLAYLTGVEYLDGRSAAWGFSGWDMLANTAGAALFIGQQRAFRKRRTKSEQGGIYLMRVEVNLSVNQRPGQLFKVVSGMTVGQCIGEVFSMVISIVHQVRHITHPPSAFKDNII